VRANPGGSFARGGGAPERVRLAPPSSEEECPYAEGADWAGPFCAQHRSSPYEAGGEPELRFATAQIAVVVAVVATLGVW
jgi:hypothetical protein